MIVSLITAMTEEGVIGRDQRLPWHIPEELQYFKSMTVHKPVVMGRKTFESMGSWALPNRPNIILTHDHTFVSPVCSVVHSVEEALCLCAQYDEIMVIGGRIVYEQFLPVASRLYVTIIHEAYVGDVYFPSIVWSDWILKEAQVKPLFTTKIYEKGVV